MAVVAAGIAGLFLHSAWEILKDARGDLARAHAEPTPRPTLEPARASGGFAKVQYRLKR
jgi:hypothetical protein